MQVVAGMYYIFVWREDLARERTLWKRAIALKYNTRPSFLSRTGFQVLGGEMLGKNDVNGMWVTERLLISED